MMETKNFLLLGNGKSIPFASVPELPVAEFSKVCLTSITAEKCRIAAFFAVPEDDRFILTAILGDPAAAGFRVLKTVVKERYPSLTAHYPGFNRFEREIHELYGIVPEGHPALKPLRFVNTQVGDMEFYRMQGKAIHEVAVGPVHAGVIEPGHFRFECMGETVYSLEISLGYQHRGVEKLLQGGPDRRTGFLIETAAGDSSIAASINYCRIMESLCGIGLSDPAVKIRQIALELERCANHIGDLGALAGDVAFLPTASFCGRIRGEYLNMSADLCGNRFGRNFIIPGGCRYPVDQEKAKKITRKLQTVSRELWNALDLMFNSPTVLDRLENTGSVSLEDARSLGLVGVAARACGLDADARRDFPVAGEKTAGSLGVDNYNGDVISRAKVRYEELKKSHDFLFAALAEIPENGAVVTQKLTPAPDMLAVSVTEAWRGELCHAAVTGSDGKFRVLKIVDPSFHNWEGLAMALRNEEIAHFPICNKSFNLSYCGHDL